MKNLYIFSIFILALFGSCFNQNTDYEKRIIGTWIENENGDTWVFSANRTLRVTSKSTISEFKFTVTDTKLSLGSGNFPTEYDISVSSDGKTLVITYAGDKTHKGILLTKE